MCRSNSGSAGQDNVKARVDRSGVSVRASHGQKMTGTACVKDDRQGCGLKKRTSSNGGRGGDCKKRSKVGWNGTIGLRTILVRLWQGEKASFSGGGAVVPPGQSGVALAAAAEENGARPLPRALLPIRSRLVAAD
jgi:hypothetical protein